MDVTTQRRCLSALAGSLLLGTIGAGAWSLSGLPKAPMTVQAIRPAEVSPQNDGTDSASTRIAPELLRLSLRSPLQDPQPVRRDPPSEATPPKQRTQVATRLNLMLLGTIIDPQRSVAIIADSSESFDIKGVGESLALSPQGVSIVRIDSDQVTLAHNGKESTITIDKSRKRGARSPRNNRGRR